MKLAGVGMAADDWRPEPANDVLRLHDIALDGADFSRRRLRILSVAGSRLVRCDFRRIRATGGGLGDGLQPTEYIECTFDGAHFKRVVPGRATFVSCSFRNVKFEEMFFHDAQFIDCVFSGRLRTVVFFAVPSAAAPQLGRATNAYLRNDFAEAHFEDVAFRRGVDLEQQVLPSGPEYLYIRNAVEAIAQAKAEIRRWPDERDREEAEIPLRVLEDDAKRGQRDVHTTKSFVTDRLATRFGDQLVSILTESRG